MERRVENGGLHQCSNKDSLKSVFFQGDLGYCVPSELTGACTLSNSTSGQSRPGLASDQISQPRLIHALPAPHTTPAYSLTFNPLNRPLNHPPPVLLHRTKQNNQRNVLLTIQLPPYSPHRLHPRRAHITLRPPRMLAALCLGDSTRPPILARDMRTVMPAPYALVVLSWVFSSLTPEQQQASREAMVLPMGIEEMNRAADEYWYLSREQRRVLALLQGDWRQLVGHALLFDVEPDVRNMLIIST